MAVGRNADKSRGKGNRDFGGPKKPFNRDSRDRTNPGRRPSGAGPVGYAKKKTFDTQREDGASSSSGELSSPTNDRLEGRNPIMEALRAGRTINKLYVAKNDETNRRDPSAGRVVAMAKEKGIPVMEVPRKNLDDMSQTHNHQGIIAMVASHEYSDIDDMIQAAKDKGEAPLLVLLDELKDAYNLGSILRIADAAGVHGVIIPVHRSIGLDSMVAKASAGAIEYVPVARVNNLSRTLLELKEKGFWVAGTDASGTISFDKADLSGPMVIVIGSEGEGMSNNVKDKCDYLLSIPMQGHVNSLNAAVAAGIVIFQAKKLQNRGIMNPTE
ncbi:MAG TPA: 23S rRNA (guanosine(2251)-2'-O)-methyltransferase RlmB [Bacillota bacterium]|nr:23S rRNA (guanosine(2251)-2'-O)-methyltransferase RlmB [Bacillota bacterium]HPE38449.1 23S rRNA (guanosine(2251)-2'-O)-methyltransferase RlmB [Bacillota bacterium]